MTSEPALNRGFADFLRALGAAGVEYLVVGGFAVAAHGYQRATKDIDIFVRPTADNARRVSAALRHSGPHQAFAALINRVVVTHAAKLRSAMAATGYRVGRRDGVSSASAR